MDTGTHPSLPALFTPHPALSDQINHNIIQSEVEGGVHLNDLPRGARLQVQTQNRRYTIVNRGDGRVLISGHPKFCPLPVVVELSGSTWGGSLLKTRFIGRGMRMEFTHPFYRTIITSKVVEIHAAC
jgi:hypothetical protein